MNTEKSREKLIYFEKYKWYALALNGKRAEYKKALSDTAAGIVGRDSYSESWQRRIRREIRELKRAMNAIEFTIASIPDTPELIPCKLYLNLHYVVGLNITETAEKLNVSESTVRRIRDRTERYFEDIPLTQPAKKEALP